MKHKKENPGEEEDSSRRDGSDSDDNHSRAHEMMTSIGESGDWESSVEFSSVPFRRALE